MSKSNTDILLNNIIKHCDRMNSISSKDISALKSNDFTNLESNMIRRSEILAKITNYCKELENLDNIEQHATPAILKSSRERLQNMLQMIKEVDIQISAHMRVTDILLQMQKKKALDSRLRIVGYNKDGKMSSEKIEKNMPPLAVMSKI